MVLDLGSQPTANSYTEEPVNEPEKFPLALNLCEVCWHAQLSFSVDRQSIFSNYAYSSGTSKTLSEYFAWFASALNRTLSNDGRVLEIAANDGSLVRALIDQGLDCSGIDPAENIVIEAQRRGLPVQLGYWPDACNKPHDLFDAIIALNVLAHVDNPLAFLRACNSNLKKDGFVLIQPSQARMFENGEFDTIYHEHLSFFNTRSMSTLAERAGLALIDTAFVSIHGDSPIYFLGRTNVSASEVRFRDFKIGKFAIDEKLFSYEDRISLFQIKTYETFALKAKRTLANLRNIISEHKKSGFKIVFVGAAAKAVTVINSGQFFPDHILDESPLKIGLHTPGCGKVVEPLSTAKQLQKPCLFVVSAWNFRRELIDKLRAIGVPKGSRFYSYFPTEALTDD